VWDVRFQLANSAVHLRECKDTVITREDRLRFYRRVRRGETNDSYPRALRRRTGAVRNIDGYNTADLSCFGYLFCHGIGLSHLLFVC
jgi:hypothetical protein